MSDRPADPVWVDALALMDVPSWVQFKLGLTPDVWQAAAMQSDSPRQVLLCSRQTGKSFTCTCIALHRAIYYPGSLVLYIAPSQRQSGELMNVTKGLTSLLAEPPELLQDASTAIKFKNGSRIISLPATEGKIRGYSAASLVVFDEASRIDDDLFFSCLPMVAVSKGRIIVASTPWGRRGFFHTIWSSDDADWTRTRITWRDCPRLPPEEIEKQKAIMPDLLFRQEYEVEFVAPEGTLFDPSDVEASYDTSIPMLFAPAGYVGKTLTGPGAALDDSIPMLEVKKDG